MWAQGPYRLARCQECGTEVLLFKGTSRFCNPCAQARYARQKALRAPAKREVGRAIREGRLPRLTGVIPCVDCGKPAQIYEHRNYAKPLDVVPACRSCNALRGPAIDMAPLWALPRRPKSIPRP